MVAAAIIEPHVDRITFLIQTIDCTHSNVLRCSVFAGKNIYTNLGGKIIMYVDYTEGAYYVSSGCTPRSRMLNFIIIV